MQTSQHDGNEFLTTSDVARECQVAGETVRAWHKAGKLAAERTARGYRLFRRADVERLKRDRAATAR
jgi:excisionase family DNA binding protein